MNIGISLILSNLGITFPDLILLLVILAGFIFYARDIRIGLMLHFLCSALLFIWFFEYGYDYKKALICTFTFFIFMCLSILAAEKATKTAGSVI